MVKWGERIVVDEIERVNQLRILVRESFYWLILHLTCLSVLLVPRSWEK